MAFGNQTISRKRCAREKQSRPKETHGFAPLPRDRFALIVCNHRLAKDQRRSAARRRPTANDSLNDICDCLSTHSFGPFPGRFTLKTGCLVLCGTSIRGRNFSHLSPFHPYAWSDVEGNHTYCSDPGFLVREAHINILLKADAWAEKRRDFNAIMSIVWLVLIALRVEGAVRFRCGQGSNVRTVRER
jgi:hypothetical protein